MWCVLNLKYDVGYENTIQIAVNGFYSKIRKDDWVAKEKAVEISVATVFTGKQDKQQAFIDLILYKRRSVENENVRVDIPAKNPYNEDKVFSDVRVG